MTRLVDALVRKQPTGLEAHHPLYRFLESDEPRLERYLALDDVVISATWPVLASARDIDATRADLADRLLRRRLLRCFDAGVRGENENDQLVRFKRQLNRRLKEGGDASTPWLEDSVQLTAYGVIEAYDRPSLRRVLVGRPDGRGFDDITRRSHMIRSDLKKDFYRVYVPQDEYEEVERLWEEASR